MAKSKKNRNRRRSTTSSQKLGPLWVRGDLEGRASVLPGEPNIQGSLGGLLANMGWTPNTRPAPSVAERERRLAEVAAELGANLANPEEFRVVQQLAGL